MGCFSRFAEIKAEVTKPGKTSTEPCALQRRGFPLPWDLFKVSEVNRSLRNNPVLETMEGPQAGHCYAGEGTAAETLRNLPQSA